MRVPLYEIQLRNVGHSYEIAHFVYVIQLRKPNANYVKEIHISCTEFNFVNGIITLSFRRLQWCISYYWTMKMGVFFIYRRHALCSVCRHNVKELTLSMQFNYLFHVDFHVKKLDLWSFISIFFRFINFISFCQLNSMMMALYTILSGWHFCQ